jgi:hypothetical protein
MPTSSGPNLLGDSNIIFHYDIDDVINSYKGEPTVNLLYSSGAVNLTNGASDIYGRCTKTDLGGGKYRFTNNGTGSSTVRLYTNQPDLINGGTYGCSIYYENLIGALSFDWCDTSVTGVNSNTGQSGRLYGYGSRGSYASPYYFLDVNFDSGGAVTLYNPQVEYKSYVTPFVGGTRSSTQGLIPLVGTSAIDLTNVSFDSNGQITFDGTNDYISVDNSTSLQFGDVFTVSAWVYPTNLSSRYGVFSTRRNNTTGCWQLEVGTASGGTNRVAVTGVGTWIFETPDNAISANVWTNICFVKPGNGIQGGTLYVNGISISPLTTTAYTILNNSDAKLIGCGTSITSFFPGKIENVCLYNNNLTASEVLNNFNVQKTRFNLS